MVPANGFEFEKAGGIKPNLVGYTKASKYNIFCDKHDTSLFSLIENESNSPLPEKAFLWMYRALCMELYKKQKARKAAENRRESDKGRSPDEQIQIQALNQEIIKDLELDIRDLSNGKNTLGEMFRQNSWGQVRYLLHKIDCHPDIMASTVLFPDFSYEGERLQNLQGSSPLEWLTVSCFAPNSQTDQGWLLWSWLAGQTSVQIKFLKSLSKQSCVFNATVSLLASRAENIFLAPSWWDNLAPSQAASFQQRLDQDDLSLRNQHYLSSEGEQYVNWTTTDIQTNEARLVLDWSAQTPECSVDR